ncbi:MAG TPA: hypothetical protein VK435_11405 [Thermodesulfovibrionales bacterium]|nr:hypothetical protein [Thermodesulfovibrionales bacterium]
MDQGIYTYIDMYSNQGTEYLLIVVVLVALIGFWRFLNMDAER